MSLPHVHTEQCPPKCARTIDVDERTVTGAYAIAARQDYGKRPADRIPRWWPFALRAWDAVWKAAGIIIAAWALKRLGIAP
jgi:hypothetical protein